MKLRIYKILLIILIICMIIVLRLIGLKYAKRMINEEKNKEAVEVFADIGSQDNQEIEMEGYKVIGIVKIPKINIEYPILDIGDIDPESAKAPMKISIIKYWGENVNDYGNLSIAGHNNKSGTMFGKTKKLEIGYIILPDNDFESRLANDSIYIIFLPKIFPK